MTPKARPAARRAGAGKMPKPAKRKPAAKAPSKTVPIRSAIRNVSPMLTDASYWALAPRPAPMDLAVEACRAMEAGRFRKRGKLYAPTVYTIGLAAADLERFGDRRRELVATLKDTLAWWASRAGVTLPGDPRVRLVHDADLRAGQVTVEAGFRAEEAARLGLR